MCFVCLTSSRLKRTGAVMRVLRVSLQKHVPRVLVQPCGDIFALSLIINGNKEYAFAFTALHATRKQMLRYEQPPLNARTFTITGDIPPTPLRFPISCQTDYDSMLLL